jgi:D-alanyl-D-alanine carboxypeptidase/D-alanyl-D-alanine-endopeptidase (penicillin-binding protein 4)
VTASWTRRLDRLAGVAGVSVALGVDGRIVYLRRGRVPQALASNEKLLTSMAALDLLGPAHRFRTALLAERGAVRDHVVNGDLWLVGGGDPTLDAGDIASLADRVVRAGIARIDGDIVGDTTAFDRGWWAPGWLRGVSRSFVARPVALRLDSAATAMEESAAAVLRGALLARGIGVTGRSGARAAPSAGRRLASIASPPLAALLVHQNHDSDNLYAELLTKALGADVANDPSTAAGAAAIQGWTSAHGAGSEVHDGSGLSDRDRSSPVDVVWLLLLAERRPWFPSFLDSLPGGGEGTLSGRLTDVAVHAKTGTLFVRPTSALSGYVKGRDGSRIAFSVLTHGLAQATAERIEDAVVRTIANARIG